MAEHDSDDTAMMRRALALAAHGPEANANPRVGCVLVDAGGAVVAAGWHRGAGTPHAEADALDCARVSGPRAATAYVTLEPCNHTGRTAALRQGAVCRGRGPRRLRPDRPQPGRGRRRQRGCAARGSRSRAASWRTRPRRSTRTWTHLVTTGRPWVTWKLATTLDGRSAAADGTSQWITGEAARADVHEQRARCGAILVGTGTALADDPQLTARRPDGSLYAATSRSAW